MNNRSKQIKPLLQHFESLEQNALANLAQSKQEYESMQLQLDQLIQYREEYRQKLQALGQNPATTVEMKRYLDFLANLETLIKQQNHILTEYENRLNNKKNLYQKAHQKNEVFHTLENNLLKKEEVIRQKREDKKLDDLAQQKWHEEHRRT